MQSRIKDLIVKGVLEYEAVSGLSIQSRHQPYEIDSDGSMDPQQAISLLLRQLTIFHEVLQLFGVETTVVVFFFRQVFSPYN